MEHASAVLLEQLAPPPLPDLAAPGFWRDFLVGMLKPLAAAGVVALAVALSFTQRLGIGREMLYAIARSFVQFSIVGFVLQFIFFQKNTAPWILLAYLFMVRIREFGPELEKFHLQDDLFDLVDAFLIGTRAGDGHRLHGRPAREAGPPREVHRLRVHPGRHDDHHGPTRRAQNLPLHPTVHHPRRRYDGRQRHGRHRCRHEEAQGGRQDPEEPGQLPPY